MTARTYESLTSAAARIGVSVKTLRRRIAQGVLPVYRCSRILRLDPNEGLSRTRVQLGLCQPRGGAKPSEEGVLRLPTGIPRRA